MNELAQRLQQAVGLDLWLVTLLAIGSLTLLVNQGVRLLLRQAARWAQTTTNHWDEALLNAASKPLRLILWLVSLGWMARVLNTQWPEPELLADALQWRNIGIVVSVAWMLWHFVGEVTQTSIQRGTRDGGDFDVTTATALSKLVRLVRLVVFVVTVITVAHTLGFQIGGLLALGGVGGIAVGLAARDLLANFLAASPFTSTGRSAWATGFAHPTKALKARSNTSAGATPASARSTKTPSTCPTPCSPPSWWKTHRA